MMALPQVWTSTPGDAWSTAQIGVEPTGLKPYFWNSILMVVPAVRSPPCSARSTAMC
jgi:glucose/mannose transport system permease protein